MGVIVLVALKLDIRMRTGQRNTIGLKLGNLRSRSIGQVLHPGTLCRHSIKVRGRLM